MSCECNVLDNANQHRSRVPHVLVFPLGFSGTVPACLPSLLLVRPLVGPIADLLSTGALGCATTFAVATVYSTVSGWGWSSVLGWTARARGSTVPFDDWWPVTFVHSTHTTPRAPSHPRMFVHATRINDTTSAHCWLLWCGRGPPCERRRASPPLPLVHPRPPWWPRPRPCPSPPPRAPTSWAHPPSPPCSRLSGTRTRRPRSSLHTPID